MFKKLLIPLDGTETSAAALPVGQVLARETGAEVLLLRVVTEREPAADAEAKAYLARLAGELGDGLSLDTVIEQGDPAEQILETARQRGIDLVVMATHGRSGIERVLHRSTEEQVLRSSPVPVLVLRPGEAPIADIQTLVVPVDGSPGSAVAVQVAEVLATATGARVVLVQVVSPLPRFGTGRHMASDWEDQTRAAARDYLDGLVQGLQERGLRAEGRAEIGEVAPTISTVAESAGADLIVMSTHARAGPARALLGSVADQVVRTAGHPVLLIRQEPVDSS